MIQENSTEYKDMTQRLLNIIKDFTSFREKETQQKVMNELRKNSKNCIAF